MFSVLLPHFIKDENGKPQVPFKTVYMTGLIRDDEGQKMSKSKGNVIDPLDMVDGITLPELLEKRTGNMMQPQLAEKIRKRTEKQFPKDVYKRQVFNVPTRRELTSGERAIQHGLAIAAGIKAAKDLGNMPPNTRGSAPRAFLAPWPCVSW